MSDAAFHVAQLNIARMLAPLDSPQLAGFVQALDPINALAEGSPGFVWRMQDEETGNNTSNRFLGDDMMIVNLTVWESIEALEDFAYRSGHVEVMRRRREWFEKMAEAFLALWWVPAGTIPTVGDAEARLVHLREHGPSEFAFTFRDAFPSPGRTESTGGAGSDERWTCPTG